MINMYKYIALRWEEREVLAIGPFFDIKKTSWIRSLEDIVYG